ncbi:hypothetical protein SAMN04489727_5743 [Amycolatopsis tolypomycina]|uniref:Uncharacterized protein n=2 Tax=Pseudonocardiaceae TaxID=2070 RepID=A0A1H4WR43_9PSEU|nr:hypothetical protein SAMN04489727_5743 [Amycolatopsis tolypomycina]
MTVDSTGTELPVITGVTTDHRGRLVGAMAIGDGPTAVLEPPDDGSVHGQISLNAMMTLLDVEELRARVEIKKRRNQR